MKRPRFDNTISTGGILQLITLLLALWGFAARLEGRLSVLETKIEPLWQQYNQSRQRIPVER